MKAFEIRNGEVKLGIPIEDGAIVVGEEGPNRSMMRVRVTSTMTVQDNKIVDIQAKKPGVMLVIRNHAGFRGSWRFVDTDKNPIDVRTIGAVIASGRCAQGTAGRTGDGHDYLMLVPAGTDFYIEREGQLYGAPRLLHVHVEDSEVTCTNAIHEQQMTAVEELLQALSECD